MRTTNDRFLMDIAFRVAEQSYANNAKVGAVMVRDDNILALGYNGTPKGWSNQCEEPHYLCTLNEDGSGCSCESDGPCPVELRTKPEVLHAESNMLAKVAKSTQSSEGTTVYTTLAPCLDCAKLMYQSGVIRVVYSQDYRSTAGLDFLNKTDVQVDKIGD